MFHGHDEGIVLQIGRRSCRINADRPANQEISRGLPGVFHSSDGAVIQNENLHILRVDILQRNVGGIPSAGFSHRGSVLQEFSFGLGPVCLGLPAALTLKYLVGTVLDALPKPRFKSCTTIFGDDENVVLGKGF